MRELRASLSRRREASPPHDARLIRAGTILRQRWRLFAGAVAAIGALSTVVVGVNLSGDFKSVVRPAARAFRQAVAAMSPADEGAVAKDSALVETVTRTGTDVRSSRVKPRHDTQITQSSPATGLVVATAPGGPAPPADRVEPVHVEGLSVEVIADAVSYVDRGTYSDHDTDVQPPKLISPGFPGPAIAGAPTQTNTVEVIVSARGDVDRVRLLTSPRRLPDMMLLASAKEWKFRPALKANQPVRYRLVLNWEVNP